MKRKELINLAKKIAKAELIIQKTKDDAIKKKAEQEIMRLSGQVSTLEDMMLIDEIVQDFFSKLS